MVGRRALRPETAGQVLMVLDLLEPDEFADYLARYYRAGLERFGVEWSYADLPTVLAAAAHMLRPASYLEIGVRRGRSMGIVSHIVPEAHLLGFDLWIPDYAGMDNPGLAFVQDELRKLGHTGCIELIEGDSHQTVPDYFKNNPDAFFDLIPWTATTPVRAQRQICRLSCRGSRSEECLCSMISFTRSTPI